MGARLFEDTRLSADNTLSCASCHDLGAGGDDGKRFSRGMHHTMTAVNSPTVFNSAHSFVQFWDGRAATLEEQVDGPVTASGEMDSDWPDVIDKLHQDDELVARFSVIYADGLTAANIKNAIATFERTLVTPNSRFDRYLLGETGAISEDEKAGYQLFKSLGCIACHQGRNVGGNLFQPFGVVHDYFKGRLLEIADLGRYNVTGDEQDRHVFKVPSLRNIELTAPYFHDGSAETLEEAVQVMGWHQLGRVVEIDDIDKIVAFLKTLTGKYEGAE